MPEAFSATHLLELGGLLLEVDDDPGAPWSQVEDARCRASISRAYYATLLRLKERLRSEARFEVPRDGANVVARRAITEVLGEAHELSVLFRRLWSFRTKADYDIGPGHPLGIADDRLDDARRACELVDKLTREELRTISSTIRLESGRLRGSRSGSWTTR